LFIYLVDAASLRFEYPYFGFNSEFNCISL